jgi:hypothetical protein
MKARPPRIWSPGFHGRDRRRRADEKIGDARIEIGNPGPPIRGVVIAERGSRSPRRGFGNIIVLLFPPAPLSPPFARIFTMNRLAPRRPLHRFEQQRRDLRNGERGIHATERKTSKQMWEPPAHRSRSLGM